MKTIRYGRLVAGWPFALLMVAGCERSTREVPEQEQRTEQEERIEQEPRAEQAERAEGVQPQRTERVAPETLPIAPQVAPPIEQQDAERAALREKQTAETEAARGAPPASNAEKSDVKQVRPNVRHAEVGGVRGEMDPVDQSAGRGGERGASGKDRTATGLSEDLTADAPEGVTSGSSEQVGAERGQTVSSEPVMLDGQVLYGGPRLPDEADIHVGLVDPETGSVVSGQVISASSEPPYAFSLSLPEGTTDASGYSLRVIIEENGQMLYSTLKPFTPNLAEGSVFPVQVQVAE